MSKVGKVEYSDVVFLEKMNEIKTTIKNSGFLLDSYKAYFVDCHMKSLIDDLYDPEKENSSIRNLYHKLGISIGNRIGNMIVYYYFAFYQDNLELLQKVLESGFEFDLEFPRKNLYLLDSQLSSHFSIDQYLFLIQNCNEEMFRFYEQVMSTISHRDHLDKRRNLLKQLNELNRSLFQSDNHYTDDERRKMLFQLKKVSHELRNFRSYRYSAPERDILFQKFADLITKDVFATKSESETELDYYSLITPDTIQVFGIDGLLSLTDAQKWILDHSEIRSYEFYERMRSFFEKYPSFSKKIIFNADLLNHFSDEELFLLTDFEIAIYRRASTFCLTSRVKSLVKNGFSFDGREDLIHPDLFKILTNDEILSLSNSGLLNILDVLKHSLDYDEMAQACNRIVHKDLFFQKVKKMIP